MNTTSIEKEIIDYLAILSPTEKQEVLSVVKTIAQSHSDFENKWDDKEFCEEMDSRTTSYENGTAKVFKFEEIKQAAIEAYQAKKAGK